MYFGTAYGSPQLSVYTKADGIKEIYKFQENYGNMMSITMYNNSITFNFGEK